MKTKKKINSENNKNLKLTKTIKNNKIKKVDYIIAIPTYKRYNQVYNKSIKTLINGGIHSKKIYIFVANENEKKEYEKVLPKNSYHKIIVGVLGINNQRKFIINYFKEGTNVVFIDDDVESIDKLNEKSDKLIKMKNIDLFIRNAFKECREKNIYLWGIYPARNVLFMKPRPKKKYGLRFILGTFYGQIICHSKDLETSLQEKEDFENTILHYKKNCGVLRFEKVTLKTKFYNHDGGISAITKDRKKVHEKAAKLLKEKYGDYGTIWQRKNGIYEFRLKSLPYKC